ncbi:hypothetical protein [Rhodanobacter lindaniclasticus]|uniref:Uncharacterized protein n=1 Tax=Rhodanobacter lindaniclasticus TaxID=75310 RepID=A0A4S3KC79_9GAMM|nr:hypothetical protein [Rhodanobacter lindaniclasticus]THD06007.1 hypothetical protein B1991_15035 [Rhodanobacter lindaniclasticus]
MKQLLQFLLAVPLLLVLAACHPATSQDAAPELELHMYRVPVAQSDAVAQQLTKVLVDSGYLVGVKAHTAMNVSQPFPGAVLVLAPATLQPSIAKAIDGLQDAAKALPDATNATTPRAPQRLRLQFWVLQARPGSGSDAADLAALEPTLKTLRQSLGVVHFSLTDAVAVATDVGGNGHVAPGPDRVLGFEVTSAAAGTYKVAVNYSDSTGQSVGELRSGVALRPGEVVVLAQAADGRGSGTSGVDAAALMNLLVLRVDPLPAAP